MSEDIWCLSFATMEGYPTKGDFLYDLASTGNEGDAMGEGDPTWQVSPEYLRYYWENTVLRFGRLREWFLMTQWLFLVSRKNADNLSLNRTIILVASI